jgi:hypothetical protein
VKETVSLDMKIAAVISLALLAACSSAQQSNLTAVKGVRSAAAEWALVNRESARGRLISSYVAGMRKASREKIAKQASELTDHSAALHAAALQALPADAPADLIAVHVHALKQIETALEPA